VHAHHFNHAVPRNRKQNSPSNRLSESLYFSLSSFIKNETDEFLFNLRVVKPLGADKIIFTKTGLTFQVQHAQTILDHLKELAVQKYFINEKAIVHIEKGGFSVHVVDPETICLCRTTNHRGGSALNLNIREWIQLVRALQQWIPLCQIGMDE
jgi:hypothetical protein